MSVLMSHTLLRSQRQTELDALLQPALRRASWLALLGAYFWALPTLATYHHTPYWPGLLGPIVLFAASLLNLCYARSYRASALALVGGLCATVAMEMLLGNAASASFMALTAVLVAGIFLGIATAASACCLLFLAPLAAHTVWPYHLPLSLVLPSLRQALLGFLLLWAAGGSIFRALSWAERRELRFWQQAREATERQAELERTSKALRDMYALLESTNRDLEIARREAEEAREVKARFAANISHELRTPLNLILGFSRIMYQTPEVYGAMRWPPELRLDLHEIYRASRHLLSMIDDILDLSRIQAQRLPLKPELVPLGDIIADAAATAGGLLRGSPVKLSLDLPPHLPQVLADSARIRQVLLNLLSNAIRFTDSGQISVSARELDGEVEVAVTDTGIGIAAEDLATIFDEFSQARGPESVGRGGAGLGLAVCRQFVQLHGGRIWVESELGKGSTFHFTLPLLAGGKSRSRLSFYAPEGWQMPLPADRLGRPVLVLAGSEATARMVARGIEGYRTIPLSLAEPLPQALASERPLAAVVVSDPLQPQQPTRAEELRRASANPDLSIIECELPTEAAAKQHLQVDAYLVKPVQTEELLAVIAASGSSPKRLLVVDDDPGFRALMARVLLAAFPAATVHCCADGSEALVALAQQAFDLLLLDLVIPGLDGLDLLRQAREEGLLTATTVIVTSGAPYMEELAELFPTRLHFSHRTPPKSKAWFGYIKALLDATRPAYAHPEAAAAPAVDRQPLPAS